MKKMLLTMLGCLLFILIAIPGAVGILYLRNAYVGVETDFSHSAFLAEPPAPLSQPLTLKIVTFNIQDLHIVGQNRPARMRHIGRVLTDLDPDVVGFQESFIEKDRDILIQALKGTRLSHHQYYPSGVGGSGLLISSAWPIQEVYFHRFTASGPARRVWEGDFWGGKGVALARVESPMGMLDIYNTHAQAGYGRAEYREVRRMQMEELAAFMNASRAQTAPAFLVGDMNCKIGAVDYETAVKNAGLTRAMTMDSRIDHIFVAKSPLYTFETLDSVEIEERVSEGDKSFRLSDHSGYMSVIKITPTE